MFDIHEDQLIDDEKTLRKDLMETEDAIETRATTLFHELSMLNDEHHCVKVLFYIFDVNFKQFAKTRIVNVNR